MTLALLILLALGLPLLAVATWARRRDLERMARGRSEIELAKARGSANARLQYPEVDAARCIGCGICVRACPEEGVLDVVHGQAVVVHGSRCVGHGRCAVECPVGAIAVTLGDLSARDDIPVLDERLESPHTPGLFLAGEVTGFALIRTAIAHGTAVAREVARRREGASDRGAPDPGAEACDGGALDLVIVGAGPAGLACALEARRLGLCFEVLEQDRLGGTVAHYPRRKLVMTQPVDLPLHGPMRSSTWSKEELMELWVTLAEEHDLPLREGVRFEGVEALPDGRLRVRGTHGESIAHGVCLALGRRGTPRRLGVPGEDLPKVAYSLVDAQSYQGRHVLVVGGGDSAIEAAVGLAEQPGNRVLLSYRRGAFSRIKARNERRLQDLLQRGALEVLLHSQVTRILPDRVELDETQDGETRAHSVPNDDVFVMAGGVPPFALLKDCGVSLDPAEREERAPAATGDPTLVRALGLASVVGLLILVWVGVHWGYYRLATAERPWDPSHEALRPARAWGLVAGGLSVGCVLANLAYLLRRSTRLPFEWGSLRAWMTVHVGTGVGALLLALVHAGLSPRHTVGGHALIALVVLVITGSVGRWLYAWVPRAANGRELELDEVRQRLASMTGEWEREHRRFGERVHQEVQHLADEARWGRSLPRRLLGALREQRLVARRLAELGREGRAEGIPETQVRRVLHLARRAHRTALAAAHFEDVRGLLASWRWLHRWVALLMVLLVLVHVVQAVRYGDLGFGLGGSR